MYLVCDLGASSADWALWNPLSGRSFIVPTPAIEQRAGGFGDMFEQQVMPWVEGVLQEGQQITETCIAVAGRVVDGSVKLTNGRRWLVKANHISEMLEARGHSGKVHLLNDFEALSLGVATLLQDESLNARSTYEPVLGELEHAAPGKRIAVCGPGTGLGVSLLILNDDTSRLPIVVSSEGGHHSFAPETPAQLEFLKAQAGIVSYEDALSKQGLLNLYNFFRESMGVNKIIDGQAYDIINIIKNAGPTTDVPADKAIYLFCEILANFCGNLVLTFNADRAVFLWGGVLKEMPINLLKYEFGQRYGDRAMHDEKVQDVPVVLLNDPQVPLKGCVLRCRHG